LKPVPDFNTPSGVDKYDISPKTQKRLYLPW